MALTDETKNNIQTPEDDVIDINLEGIKRSRFRINGRVGAIVELNLSDLSIVDRLEKGVQKLAVEMEKVASIPDDDEAYSEKMRQADQKMREYVDYIFDYPVSAVCAPQGSTMFDPTDGVFRYEHIIDGLTKLYADNINAEYKKINARLKKHTEKYVSKKRK